MPNYTSSRYINPGYVNHTGTTYTPLNYRNARYSRNRSRSNYAQMQLLRSTGKYYSNRFVTMAELKSMYPTPEYKLLDTDTNSVITTAASVVPLDLIALGTGENAKIGDKITLKSLMSRISIICNATALVNFLRVIYFSYDATQGSLPAVGNILQVPTNYRSPLADDYSQNIKVWHDKTYALAVGSDQVQSDKFFRKIQLDIEYNPNSTQSNKNSLFALYISDQAVNGPTVQDYVRIRYVDS